MIEANPQALDRILDRQRFTWESGDEVTAESLLAGTEFEGNSEALLDLLYNEILIREELGHKVTFDEYLTSYPDLADELNLHFEIHHAIRLQVLLDSVADPNGDKDLDGTNEAGSLFPDDTYELISPLGQGAMATVYQARHKELNRNVALKLFEHGRRLNSREAFRVRMEAEAMARLSHPNIVKIFDIGQRGGIPFLALELAEGGTLAGKLQQFRFTPRAAAELIESLARAIHHAHERNIIHRDLKPANVLFAADGKPMITDFGLAKVQQDRLVSPHDATRTGESIGTPRYMAPEQASGQLDRICPATDVHALGVLLYECLTGRAPFLATSVVQTLQQICNDDPVPPRRLQSGIPRDLETICLQCLHKSPRFRYGTALELADDLRRYLNDEPISARPTPTWEKALKWCRRKPAQAVLTAVTVVMLVVTTSWLLFSSMAHKAHLAEQRSTIAKLVHEGRRALEQDDVDLAQAQFEAAWLIVQSTPELSDHETSVSGWLDHSRNVASRYQWEQRIPPPTFDDRRDEALLASLLIPPREGGTVDSALEAIHAAREFIPSTDARWQPELQVLALQEAALLEIAEGPEVALAFLKASGPFESRLFQAWIAALEEQLGHSAETEDLTQKFPAEPASEHFQNGMNFVREQKFDLALTEFDSVLDEEPGHFAARLFQAICFLQLDRPTEARVALTACIAQRPQFQWNYYWRAQAELKLRRTENARRDLLLASRGRTESSVSTAALKQLATLKNPAQQPTERELE